MIRLQKKEKNVNLKVKRSKKTPNAWTTHGLANGTGGNVNNKGKILIRNSKKVTIPDIRSNTSKKRNKITKD